LVGTNEFLSSCNKIFENKTGVSLTPSSNPHTGMASEYAVGGRLQLLKIYEFLYKDASIYLKRKYDVFSKVSMEPSELVTALIITG